MEIYDKINELQRKVEIIIHSTTEEMRDAQPGVMEWRRNYLKQITDKRNEIINKPKELQP